MIYILTMKFGEILVGMIGLIIMMMFLFFLASFFTTKPVATDYEGAGYCTAYGDCY